MQSTTAPRYMCPLCGPVNTCSYYVGQDKTCVICGQVVTDIMMSSAPSSNTTTGIWENFQLPPLPVYDRNAGVKTTTDYPAILINEGSTFPPSFPGSGSATAYPSSSSPMRLPPHARHNVAAYSGDPMRPSSGSPMGPTPPPAYHYPSAGSPMGPIPPPAYHHPSSGISGSPMPILSSGGGYPASSSPIPTSTSPNPVFMTPPPPVSSIPYTTQLDSPPNPTAPPPSVPQPFHSGLTIPPFPQALIKPPITSSPDAVDRTTIGYCFNCKGAVPCVFMSSDDDSLIKCKQCWQTCQREFTVPLQPRPPPPPPPPPPTPAPTTPRPYRAADPYCRYCQRRESQAKKESPKLPTLLKKVPRCPNCHWPIS